MACASNDRLPGAVGHPLPRKAHKGVFMLMGHWDTPRDRVSRPVPLLHGTRCHGTGGTGCPVAGSFSRSASRQTLAVDAVGWVGELD
jgi:hypothetical protein